MIAIHRLNCCPSFLWRCAALLFGVNVLAGCSRTNEGDNQQKPIDGENLPGNVPPGRLPASVDIAAGGVTVGFYGGVLREQRSVTRYKITQHPVTVAEYRECVKVGGCQTPAASDQCKGSGEGGVLTGSTFSEDSNDEVPITCVPPKAASTYCKWAGGRLPSLAEWLLAARGPEVRKYPWGDSHGGCDYHPSVEGPLAMSSTCCVSDSPCSVAQLARVGSHPKGNSPVGLQDVLLSPAEYVINADGHGLGSCSGGGGFCVVGGRHGSPETAMAVHDEAMNKIASFRCVVEMGR